MGIRTTYRSKRLDRAKVPKMINEKWAPVDGYENYYEVSTNGRVRSLDRNVLRIGTRIIKGQLIAPKLNGAYPAIKLCRDGVRKYVALHRLVARAFIGVKPKGLHTCHKDGNKLNNRISNLRYDTVKNNSEDSFSHRTMSIGARHYNTKLSQKDVIEIRASKLSSRELAANYGVNSRHINAIKAGKKRVRTYE